MATGTRPSDLHSRLAARLCDQANDIRRLVAGIDEETLTQRPRPGKWALKEIVCHLWRVQEVIEGRIEAMLTQHNPEFVSYDQDNDPEFVERLRSPGAELAEGFLAEREQLATLLASLSPADWRRSGRHPEYPHYDVLFQVEYLAYHEAHHIYQILQSRSAMGKIPN
jgi:hypothetical protein